MHRLRHAVTAMNEWIPKESPSDDCVRCQDGTPEAMRTQGLKIYPLITDFNLTDGEVRLTLCAIS